MKLGLGRARCSALVFVSLTLGAASLAHADPQTPLAPSRVDVPTPEAARAAEAARALTRQETPQAQLDQEAAPQGLRAWAEGVSETQQAEARRDFAEGNRLLRDSLFADAAAKYREALQSWDHPGIHYNLALSLINLERPLEVREHLIQALRYGPEPLDADKFNHVQSYLKLIEQQLAPLDIVCDIPGAEVLLDGRVLFRAPSHYRDYVEPGERVIRARKAGFVQSEYHRTLLPGRPTNVRVRLYRDGELIEHRHRFEGWIPIAVAGAGALFTTAGAVLLLQSNNKLEAFDQELERRSECSSGCVADRGLTRLRERGETYRTLSTIGFASGGTLLASAGVLFYLNRDRPYRITPEERDRKPLLQPLLAPGVAALFATGRF